MTATDENAKIGRASRDFLKAAVVPALVWISSFVVANFTDFGSRLVPNSTHYAVIGVSVVLMSIWLFVALFYHSIARWSKLKIAVIVGAFLLVSIGFGGAFVYVHSNYVMVYSKFGEDRAVAFPFELSGELKDKVELAEGKREALTRYHVEIEQDARAAGNGYTLIALGVLLIGFVSATTLALALLVVRVWHELNSQPGSDVKKLIQV